MAIDPSPTELQALAAADDGRPFVMLYLVRFVAGGRERYAEYALRAQSMLDRIGARVLYGGEGAGAPVVGGRGWDMAAVIRYPSRGAFVGLAQDPEYAALAPLRQGAIGEIVLQPMQDWPGR